MLTQLIYISRAVGPQTTTVTSQILETARAFNKSHDLTGVLCQGKGLYVQVLEGERSVVNSLYRSIAADSRHVDAEIVLFGEIKNRQFKDWSMALVNLSIDDPMVTMKHPEFDPYSADSRAIIGLITELLSSSSAIQTPG
ncbi:MAG: BLUF domain-containing protein [Betaproteobacteria bacterium]|nr:BLUF domain-containing protein [Betaproteobacteria bacterium]